MFNAKSLFTFYFHMQLSTNAHCIQQKYSKYSCDKMSFLLRIIHSVDRKLQDSVNAVSGVYYIIESVWEP